MTDKGPHFDLSKLKEIRHWLHEHPELSEEEFETMKKIKSVIVDDYQVDEKKVTLCGKTGWFVDIYGKGEACGKPKLIALRSDHDALPIPEKNPHLEYESKNKGVGHMCGHDGHTTCLLGGMAVLLDNLNKIPSDRGVRFLFQPAEEGRNGAGKMIRDGCLEGVSEVYGCHNLPNRDYKEKLLVSDGAMMAAFTMIKIKIHGVGGHGSCPEKCKNPLPVAAKVFLEVNEGLAKYQKEQSQKMRFSLTAFNGGHTFNVIPPLAEIMGSARTFEKEDPERVMSLIRNAVEKICADSDFTFDCELRTLDGGAVINTPKNAQYVRQVAEQMYGKDLVSDRDLPIYASEDFSEFLNVVPGCFFFQVGKNLPSGTTLHSDMYDFDDSIIEDLSTFWFKLSESRLLDTE